MNKPKLVIGRIVVTVLLIILELLWILALFDRLQPYIGGIEAVMRAVSVVIVICMISMSRHYSYNIMWIVIILAFPLAGTVVFLFLEVMDRVSSKTYKNIVSETEKSQKYLEQDADVLDAARADAPDIAGQFTYISESSGFPFYENTGFDYYGFGEEGWPVMLEEMKKAEKFIFLEYFIIAPGKMWEPMLEILQEKAQEGVLCRVLYDDMGSINKLPYDYARQLDEAAARVGWSARVHIKVDTGLHRLGLDADGAVDEALAMFAMPHIKVEGLFTHLALRVREADEAQIARLRAVAEGLRRRGADFGMLHACDSIGMVRYPEYRFDAVRTGAWLYGVVPSRYPNPNDECRLPVRFCARVAQVRRVAAGEYLGYDEDHPLARDCVIATLSAGYADGYPRVNSVGEVWLRGRRAPIAGLACMDQLTVDVTDVPGVAPGDVVTLLGDDIGINEVAAWTHSNRNELLSRLGRRVPRVYMRGGRPEGIVYFR